MNEWREREREKRAERKRKREKKNRKNVDVMPITRVVDGVGLGDWGSEGGSGRWWRRRRGVNRASESATWWRWWVGTWARGVGVRLVSLDRLLTSGIQVYTPIFIFLCSFFTIMQVLVCTPPIWAKLIWKYTDWASCTLRIVTKKWCKPMCSSPIYKFNMQTAETSSCQAILVFKAFKWDFKVHFS